MVQKQYSYEFKEQVIKECNEVGNVSLVARMHDISPNTVHGWVRAAKKIGNVKPLPKNEAKRLSEVKKRLESVSKENNTLKKDTW